MALKLNKNVPRTNLITMKKTNSQTEKIYCIDVPRIFDQYLIKRTLVYAEGFDTDSTDWELRSTPLIRPKRYLYCRDFDVKLTSLEKTPLKLKAGYYRVIINFVISFYADYLDVKGNKRSEFYEINRTETIPKFYIPDSPAQRRFGYVENKNSIKLELLAQALDGKLSIDNRGDEILDITLDFHLIVKSEINVPLLVPNYGYYPLPYSAFNSSRRNYVLEDFEEKPTAKFYPDEKLKLITL
ncbi:hypothetical protein N3C_1363 [Clostridium sp. N3C]|uniref:hypothetical protein n=1 Tax=Clostridium sp. N3C TaxID=1776758 RepID=UPI00092DEFBA|nr:hypothetical protein [Clostridium sp. N3C]SCN23560.1 hypothetical protein N3C_1363 [Clostridium sp. N3C]